MYVKVVNKSSGLHQRFTQKVWDNMNTNNPKQAKKYEFLYQCDANGNALTETSKPEDNSDVMRFESHIKAASQHIKDEKLEEAKKEIELAKAISPTSEVVKAMENHVETSENMKREFEAEDLMRQAKQAQEEARLEDAKELIEKAMSICLDPETYREISNEINALIVARDEAIAKVEKLTADLMNEIEAGNLDECKKLIDELLNMDPDNKFANEQLPHLNEMIAARDQAIAAYGGDGKDSGKKGKKK